LAVRAGYSWNMMFNASLNVSLDNMQNYEYIEGNTGGRSVFNSKDAYVTIGETSR
jgi:predicted secreted protein